MATLQDLRSVVKETLESRGVLDQIKARIRAEVFSALDDPSEQRPTLSNENLLINELIRDYLEFNKYKYTASVLQAESGQPPQPLDRDFLAQELNVAEDRDTASVPLLYGIVAHFLSQGKRDKMFAQRSATESVRLAGQSARVTDSHNDVTAEAGTDPDLVVVRGTQS